MQREELDRLISERYARRGEELATCCHDLRTGMTSWSPGMYRVLGLPLGDGHPPKGFGLALYSRESKIRLEAAVAEATQRHGGRLDLELTIQHAGGHYIGVRVVGVVTFESSVPAYLDATMAERATTKAVHKGGGVGR